MNDYIRKIIHECYLSAKEPPTDNAFTSDLIDVLGQNGYAIGPAILVDRHEPLREESMNIVGGLFAVRFVGEMAEIYIEDDGWYHWKMTFNRFWVPDLVTVATKAKIVGEAGETAG